MVLSTGSASVVAVIPARGGSKGIPRKNLASVGGRPLIVWSIEAALASAEVDRVIVSTDDDEIAEVARGCGAEVPFLRPVELARDDSPDLPVFQHLLGVLDERGETPELLVHLRPTSPRRAPGFIDLGVRTLRDQPGADSVRSLSVPPKSPYKMWTVDDGTMAPLVGGWDEGLFNGPRQRLPEVWVHDGVLDVVRARVVRGGSMSGRRIVPVFTPPGTAIDIDTPEDLRRADELLGGSDC